MIVGVNLRTTMVDKSESLFNDQCEILFNSGTRSIYYADTDDEFEWFIPQNGHWYRDRLYRWWLNKGAEVLHPIANSNVGVETSVPPAVWSSFLNQRKGWATMARKDLISAIIRTKHPGGWDWLLKDAERLRREVPKDVIGVIGADLYLFGTDAWLPGVRKTLYTRLTPQASSQFSQLGPIRSEDTFAEFALAAKQAWRAELIDDACFVYDHGNGARVESKSGELTPNVVEFGTSVGPPRFRSAWEGIVETLRRGTPKRALVHTVVDPSEAWRWKESGGTKPLWTYSGYARLKRTPHEFTLWPSREGRQAIRDAFKALAG